MRMTIETFCQVFRFNCRSQMLFSILSFYVQKCVTWLFGTTSRYIFLNNVKQGLATYSPLVRCSPQNIGSGLQMCGCSGRSGGDFGCGQSPCAAMGTIAHPLLTCSGSFHLTPTKGCPFLHVKSFAEGARIWGTTKQDGQK